MLKADFKQKNNGGSWNNTEVDFSSEQSQYRGHYPAGSIDERRCQPLQRESNYRAANHCRGICIGHQRFLSPQPSSTGIYGKPKAFLNWILFDEQFNYVSTGSGFEAVGSNDSYTTHTHTNMPISKNGFLYIYTSNETPNVDVLFDMLQFEYPLCLE